MIRLLLRHGALTNLRTADALGTTEALLPLHVAVEDTCLRKYLEDNLLLPKDDSNYPAPTDVDVYRIIHLLCLPEMKIFLDTTRLLAAHTDNLVDEICNYINDGKLL